MSDLTKIKPGFYSQVGISSELFRQIVDSGLPLIIGTAPIYKDKKLEITLTPPHHYYILGEEIYLAKSFIADFSNVNYGFTNGYVVGLIAYEVFQDLVAGDNITIKYGNVDSGYETISYTYNGTGSLTLTDFVNNIPSVFTNKIGFAAFGSRLFIYSLDKDNTIKIVSASSKFGVSSGNRPNAIYISNVLFNKKCSITLSVFKTDEDYKVNLITNEQNGYALYSDDMGYSIPVAIYSAYLNNAENFLVYQLKLEEEYTSNDIYSAFENALKEAEKIRCNMIIPMLPINEYDISSLILNHVAKCSSGQVRKERIAIMSVSEVDSKIDIQNLNYNEIFANSEYSNRFLICMPGKCYFVYNGKTYTYNGTFKSVAFAFQMLSYDEATSMSRKLLNGFSLDYPDLRTDQEINDIVNKGYTYIETLYGNPVVRRSITTCISNIAGQEISVTRSIDRVVKELRETLESNYVGQKKIPGETLHNIEKTTISVLDRMVSLGMISGYKDVVASDDFVDPRMVRVKLSISPVYVLLWGMIEVTITL